MTINDRFVLMLSLRYRNLNDSDQPKQSSKHQLRICSGCGLPKSCIERRRCLVKPYPSGQPIYPE